MAQQETRSRLSSGGATGVIPSVSNDSDADEIDDPIPPALSHHKDRDFIALITKIILYLALILSRAYCGFFILEQSARIAMKFCRYLSAVAALFMFISVVLICVKIMRWWMDVKFSVSKHNIQRISNTVIVLIGSLSFVSFVGCMKIIPTIIILCKYDFALDYTDFYEVYFDIVYNIVFSIFLPLLVVYAIAFASSYKPCEKTKNILLSTLVLCYMQRWMYETLTVNERSCQKLFEEGFNSSGCQEMHFDFITNLKKLTKGERQMYDSLIADGPYYYTCTMTLFPAIGALLMTLARTKAYKNGKIKSLDGICMSKCRKICVAALMAVTVIGSFGVLFTQPILVVLHEYLHEYKELEWAFIGFELGRLLRYALSATLFAIVWHAHKKQSTQLHLNNGATAYSIGDNDDRDHLLIEDHEESWRNDESGLSHYDQPPESPTNNGVYCARLVNTWHRLTKIFSFDHPDQAIMGISGTFMLVLYIIEFIVHVFVSIIYAHSLPEISLLAQIFLNDVANFALVASFLAQYQAITTYLNIDRESMKKLRKDTFFICFAPGALLINILCFGVIYRSNTNFWLPTYPTTNIFFDNLLSTVDLAYPGLLLFSMMAALCWMHIVERLHKVGAYRIIPLEAEDD